MYRRKLSAASFVRKSKLIVGLDLTTSMIKVEGLDRDAEVEKLENKARDIIDATADYVVAFKFNRQLALPLGLFNGIERLVEHIHDIGLTAIMDCKLNDIGNTNEHIARYYFDAGFDALIVNPFVGWESGLDSVFKLARSRDRGIITLCYMSHPASHEGYGLYVSPDKKGKNLKPMYHYFADRAKMWDVDGVIVGATYIDKIREIRKVLGDNIPIISPGIGAQGGSAKEAIDAGASFVIVARSIINAEDPKALAQEIAAQTQ